MIHIAQASFLLRKITMYNDLKAGHEVAKAIGESAPNALFCGFSTFIKNDGSVGKLPKSKTSNGVDGNTPVSQLIASDQIGLEEPRGEFWGLNMHAPIKTIDGYVITTLDLDWKRSDQTRDPKITALLEISKRKGLLIEKSFSNKGAHIFFLSKPDSTLPKKIKLGNHQEIEIFGHPSSTRISLMLTGREVSGKISKLSGSVKDLLAEAGIALEQSTNKTPIDSSMGLLTLQQDTIDHLRNALKVIPSDDREVWVKYGHALKTLPSNLGWELFREWSAKSDKYDESDAISKWQSFTPTQTGYAAIFKHAQDLGWINPLKANRHLEPESLISFDEFEQFRIDLLDIDDCDDAPLPHIVENWSPENEIALLGSHGGSGKSYVALNLGIHVALGRPFGGLTTKQTNVVFYSAEDPARVLRYRIRKLCKALQIDSKLLSGKLHLLDVSDTDPSLHRGRGFTDAKTETAALNHLARYINKHNIGFCIIDNASDTFEDDEIKRSAVKTFIRSIRTHLARPNRAVLLLAHINKANARGGRNIDSEDYSGSTAWHNSVRSRLSLNTDKSSGVMTITQHKANLGELALPVTLEWIDGVPLAGVQNPDREAHAIAQRANDKARDNSDKQVLVEIIQAFTNRGESVNTSMTGAYSTFKLLKSDPTFPKVLDGERFKRLIREMQDEKLILRKIVKTPARKEKEIFVNFAPMRTPPDDLGGKK